MKTAIFRTVSRAQIIWGLCVLQASLFFGCQDYPFQYVPRHRISVTHLREVVVQSPDSDILFVIDNSGSMEEEQDNLKRNTKLFIDELAKSDNAYRVGVVTTDLFDDEDGGRLRMSRASQTQLTKAGCDISPNGTGLPYLVRPDPDSPTVEDERCRLVADFIETVDSLGVGGSGREAGLEAARRALDVTHDAFSENEGFLREDADLALVFLTDEDDCSFEDMDSVDGANVACYQHAEGAIDTSSYVDFFAGLKGESGVRKVRAALIGGGVMTGEGGGDFAPAGCFIKGNAVSANCGCWSSSDDEYFCSLLPAEHNNVCTNRDACGDWCLALPANRYNEFMDDLSGERVATGFPRGTFEDSICQPNYDQTMLRIVRNVISSSCFTLETPALSPDAVQLTVARHDVGSGESTEVLIPRYAPSGNGKYECRSCGDCPEGAWQYVDKSTFCLECGLIKSTGDEFHLVVVNEVIDEAADQDGEEAP